MTSLQLFESLQYLDDALLEESSARRRAPVKRWLPLAAAACLALAVGAGALLYRPAPVMKGTTEPGAAPPQQVAGAAETARPVQPVGVPGPGAAPDAAPAPDVLAWNELSEADAAAGSGGDVAGVMQVAEPLTAAQLAACAPEIREEWMQDFTGCAAYYLKDGAGGLAQIELKVRNAGSGRTYTVRLRDVSAPEALDCIVRPQPETDRASAINGLEYCAYRLNYYHGEGDPTVYPPEAWTEYWVIFEKENVVYTLLADAPAAQSKQAECDLRDLLLCYAGTHGVPDLSSFHCGEYLYRDDDLTLAEALADPDFGAYLPAEGPEGFAFDFSRRYQFEEAVNYLMAFWTQGRADLQWLVQPVTEEARARVVAAEEPERYDWNRYPVPWSAYAAPENWATVENPVFRIGELTMELVSARAHPGDEGMIMFRFGVLYDSGVLVEVNAKGVSPEWVYEALTRLG